MVLDPSLYPFAAVATLAPLLVILAIWELVWKGFGLWHASQNGHKGWFIAILVVNSAGILPIAYLLFFAGPPQHSMSSRAPAAPVAARHKPKRKSKK